MSPASRLLAALLLGTALAQGAAAAGSEPATTPGPLRVEGNHFVDASGHTVVLRGLALADPYHLAQEGHWDQAYFKAARDWGATVVRIPVHPVWWREAGAQQYFAWLDQGIGWAEALGMYVIIDWHSIGNPLTGIPQRPIYLTSREETWYFWYQVALRYQHRPAVAFYELFNEPTNDSGRMGPLPWPEYKAYVEGLIDMLYHVDDAKIPLVAGFDWAYELREVRNDPIGYPGVAYVTHPYPQKRDPPWEAQWEQDWGFVADRYPVFATEFGFVGAGEPGAHVPATGDERYGEAITTYFDRKGVSWTVWVFDPVWTPSLIRDWNFTPTREGRYFKAVLQLENLAAAAGH